MKYGRREEMKKGKGKEKGKERKRIEKMKYGRMAQGEDVTRYDRIG